MQSRDNSSDPSSFKREPTNTSFDGGPASGGGGGGSPSPSRRTQFRDHADNSESGEPVDIPESEVAAAIAAFQQQQQQQRHHHHPRRSPIMRGSYRRTGSESPGRTTDEITADDEGDDDDSSDGSQDDDMLMPTAALEDDVDDYAAQDDDNDPLNRRRHGDEDDLLDDDDDDVDSADNEAALQKLLQADAEDEEDDEDVGPRRKQQQQQQQAGDGEQSCQQQQQQRPQSALTSPVRKGSGEVGDGARDNGQQEQDGDDHETQVATLHHGHGRLGAGGRVDEDLGDRDDDAASIIGAAAARRKRKRAARQQRLGLFIDRAARELRPHFWLLHQHRGQPVTMRLFGQFSDLRHFVLEARERIRQRSIDALKEKLAVRRRALELRRQRQQARREMREAAAFMTSRSQADFGPMQHSLPSVVQRQQQTNVENRLDDDDEVDRTASSRDKVADDDDDRDDNRRNEEEEERSRQGSALGTDDRTASDLIGAGRSSVASSKIKHLASMYGKTHISSGRHHHHHTGTARHGAQQQHHHHHHHRGGNRPSRTSVAASPNSAESGDTPPSTPTTPRTESSVNRRRRRRRYRTNRHRSSSDDSSSSSSSGSSSSSSSSGSSSSSSSSSSESSSDEEEFCWIDCQTPSDPSGRAAAIRQVLGLFPNIRRGTVESVIDNDEQDEVRHVSHFDYVCANISVPVDSKRHHAAKHSSSHGGGGNAEENLPGSTRWAMQNTAPRETTVSFVAMKRFVVTLHEEPFVGLGATIKRVHAHFSAAVRKFRQNTAARAAAAQAKATTTQPPQQSVAEPPPGSLSLPPAVVPSSTSTGPPPPLARTTTPSPPAAASAMPSTTDAGSTHHHHHHTAAAGSSSLSTPDIGASASSAAAALRSPSSKHHHHPPLAPKVPTPVTGPHHQHHHHGIRAAAGAGAGAPPRGPLLTVPWLVGACLELIVDACLPDPLPMLLAADALDEYVLRSQMFDSTAEIVDTAENEDADAAKSPKSVTQHRSHNELIGHIARVRRVLFMHRGVLNRKEHLLLQLLSSSMRGSRLLDHEGAADHYKVVLSSISRISRRLEDAREALSQTNGNLVSLISTQQAKASNDMSAQMKILSLVTLASVPVQILVGLFGVNMRVPSNLESNDHDITPFLGLVGAILGWLAISIPGLFWIFRDSRSGHGLFDAPKSAAAAPQRQIKNNNKMDDVVEVPAVVTTTGPRKH